MPEDKLRKLYDNVSESYDLPDFETFRVDMTNENKRKRFYENISQEYDMPDYGQFVSDMGFGEPQKKKGIQPSPPQQNMQQLFQGRFGAGSPPSPSTSELGGSTLTSGTPKTPATKKIDLFKGVGGQMSSDATTVADFSKTPELIQEDIEKADPKYWAKRTEKEAIDRGYENAEQLFEDRLPYLTNYLGELDKQEYDALEEWRSLKQRNAPESDAAFSKYLDIRAEQRGEFANIQREIDETKKTLERMKKDGLLADGVYEKENAVLAKRQKLIDDAFKPVYDPQKSMVDFIEENKSEIAQLTKGKNAKQMLAEYVNALYTQKLDMEEKLGLEPNDGGFSRYFDEWFIRQKDNFGGKKTGEQYNLDKLYELDLKLRTAVKLYALNRTGYKPDTPETIFAKGFAKSLVPSVTSKTPTSQQIAQNINSVIEEAGISNAVIKERGKEIEETAQPYTPYSAEWWAEATAPTAAIMLEFIPASMISTGALKSFDLGRKLIRVAETGKAGDLGSVYLNNLAKTKVGRGLVQSLAKGGEYGVQSATLATLFPENESEMNLISGMLAGTGGSLASKTTKALFNPMIGSITRTFGAKSPQAVIAIQALGSKVKENVSERAIGELVEETIENLVSIYRETENFNEFLATVEEQFGTLDKATQYTVQVLVMGVGMGLGSEIGKALMSKGVSAYDNLDDSEKVKVDAIMNEVNNEEKEIQNKTINEQEKDDGTTTDTSGIKTDEQGTVDGTIETPPSVGVVSETGVEGEGVQAEEVTTPTVSPPALRDVESTAKALEDIYNSELSEPNKIIKAAEVVVPIIEALPNERKLELAELTGDRSNSIRKNKIAIEYAKAKLKPENTRTNQEQELVQAVESLLSKEQTTTDIGSEVAPDVSNPALKDVESTAKALEGALREGGKVDEDGFQYRNEKKVMPIVDTFTDKMDEDYQRDVFENEIKTPEQFLSEAYHTAKADGSNPQLVEAVESLLGTTQPTPPTEVGGDTPTGINESVEGEVIPEGGQEIAPPTVSQETVEVTQPTPRTGEGATPTVTPEVGVGETVEVEEKQDEAVEPQIQQAAQVAGVKAKNIRGLYDINRKMFGQDRLKSIASAIVMDRMIGAMAKRAGIPKNEMYSRIKFEKSTEANLPQGVKMQVDAWHGSPYQFDKFSLNKIGTGEGVQAFGWGLYFTDLESIAKHYAEALGGKPKVLYKGKNINDISEFGDIFYYLDPNNSGFIPFTKVSQVEKMLDTVEVMANSFLKSNYDKNNIYEQSYKEESENVLKHIAEIRKNLNDLSVQQGRVLYKVSLHKGKTPDQYTWLEWDKPISDKALELFQSFNKQQGINLAEPTEPVSAKDRMTGSKMYNWIAGKTSQKEASLFLLENGIDGIKYPAESIARGATSDTARGSNYVVFDENAVSIEEVIKFQRDAEKARGAAMVNMDGTAVIYALTDPNVTTPLHELAHVFEHYLTEAEKNTVIKAAKTKGWTTETSEYFARGFEKYLAEGKSPIKELQNLFDKFKQWLTDIYNGIIDSQIDVQLNRPMRKIYSQMLGKEIQPPKDLSPAERENLINIANKVGVNFREVQNVYNKYTPPSERKPLDQITEADYVKAQTARLTSPQDQANFKDTFISRLNALKEKFKSLEKGRKQGIMSTKALIAELQNLAKEYDKATGVDKATKSPRTERTLRNRRGGIRTFKDLDAYKRYVDKVVKDGNYADKVTKAKGIAKKIQKLTDSKKLTASDRSYIANLEFLKPNMVSNIDEYIQLLEKFEQSLRGAKLAENARKTELDAFINREKEYITKLEEKLQKEEEENQKLDDIAEAQDAIEQGLYSGTVGDYLEDLELSRQEDIDAKSAEAAAMEEAREKINAAREGKNVESEISVKSLAKVLMANKDFMDALAENFTPTQVENFIKWVNTPTSKEQYRVLSLDDSTLLSNALQNAYENGDFSGMGSIIAKTEATVKVGDLAKSNPKFKNIDPNEIKNMTTRNVTTNIVFDLPTMEKMDEILKRNWGRLLAKMTTRHAILFDKAKSIIKKYKLDTKEQQTKLHTYAFINQWFSRYNTEEKNQHIKSRAKKLVDNAAYVYNEVMKNALDKGMMPYDAMNAQDTLIALQELGIISDLDLQVDNGKGGYEAKYKLNEDFNPDEMESKMTSNELAAYREILDIFSQMRPSVKRNTMLYTNQQWDDIENYFPTISRQTVEDIAIQSNGSLAFISQQIGLPKTQGRSKQRVENPSNISSEKRIYELGFNNVLSQGIWQNILISDSQYEINYLVDLFSAQSPLRKLLGGSVGGLFSDVRNVYVSRLQEDLANGFIPKVEPTATQEAERFMFNSAVNWILKSYKQIKQLSAIPAIIARDPAGGMKTMALYMFYKANPYGKAIVANTDAFMRNPIALNDIHLAQFPIDWVQDKKGFKKAVRKGTELQEKYADPIAFAVGKVRGKSGQMQDAAMLNLFDRKNNEFISLYAFVQQYMRDGVTDLRDIKADLNRQFISGDFDKGKLQWADRFIELLNSASHPSEKPNDIKQAPIKYFLQSFSYITSNAAKGYKELAKRATSKEDAAQFSRMASMYWIQAAMYRLITFMLTNTVMGYVADKIISMFDDDEEKLIKDQDLREDVKKMKAKAKMATSLGGGFLGFIADIKIARRPVYAMAALSIAANAMYRAFMYYYTEQKKLKDPDFIDYYPKDIMQGVDGMAGIGIYLGNLVDAGETLMRNSKTLYNGKMDMLPELGLSITPLLSTATGSGYAREISTSMSKEQRERLQKAQMLIDVGLTGEQIKEAMEYLKNTPVELVKNNVLSIDAGDQLRYVYVVDSDEFYTKKVNLDNIKGSEYNNQPLAVSIKKLARKIAVIRPDLSDKNAMRDYKSQIKEYEDFLSQVFASGVVKHKVFEVKTQFLGEDISIEEMGDRVSELVKTNISKNKKSEE